MIEKIRIAMSEALRASERLRVVSGWSESPFLLLTLLKATVDLQGRCEELAAVLAEEVHQGLEELEALERQRTDR